MSFRPILAQSCAGTAVGRGGREGRRARGKGEERNEGGKGEDGREE
jgi:hypothetical protein